MMRYKRGTARGGAMLMKKPAKGSMPDVTSHSSSVINSKINWVGMDKLTVPMIVNGESCLAHADVYVNVVDPSAKGIHMSRLFLTLGEELLKKSLTVKNLNKAIERLIESQKGLSDSASLLLKWDQPILRKALLSENNGWKTYPHYIKIVKVGGKTTWNVGFGTFYSSTCPCSSALARQLIQEEFKNKFSKKSLNIDEIVNWLGGNQIAAPHSQRSRADVSLTFESGKENLDFLKYIDAIENALKTPVQTAVKREDEQEFARLNGENLMFVEDALRRMKDALNGFRELKNFKVKAQHFESLHAHNAVGSISKN
jgi:GTP cyclohydrolase IB